jgi:hypothetical protein
MMMGNADSTTLKSKLKVMQVIIGSDSLAFSRRDQSDMATKDPVFCGTERKDQHGSLFISWNRTEHFVNAQIQMPEDGLNVVSLKPMLSTCLLCCGGFLLLTHTLKCPHPAFQGQSPR